MAKPAAAAGGAAAPEKKGKKKTKPEDTQEKQPEIPQSEISIHELAKLEKLRGNQDFHKGNYSSAIISYTKAIALSKNPHLLVSLFTNKAISRLRSQVEKL